MPDPTPTPTRVLLVGGSVAAGLGVRGRAFGHRYGQLDRTPPTLLDLTESGRMIDELDGRLDEITAFAPDVALICAGMSEHLVHPPKVIQDAIERFAPAGWHGVAGLQPRPYFSRRLTTRLRQRVVSWAKTRVKRLALKVGSRQRMSTASFQGRLTALVDRLEAAGTRTVIVTTWPVEESLFPGTNAAYARLDVALRAVAADRPGVVLLDPSSLLDVWGDYLEDRCHWNEMGHDVIAREAERLVAERWPAGGAPTPPVPPAAPTAASA